MFPKLKRGLKVVHLNINRCNDKGSSYDGEVLGRWLSNGLGPK